MKSRLLRQKEGQSSTIYRKLVAVLIFYCLFIIAIYPVYAPRYPDEYVERTNPNPLAFTSQYNNIDSLSFGSDNEFRTWAALSGFGGDGSFDNPLYITKLNVTGLSEPSLKLSNITNTWFVFEDCIFQTHLWYGALDLTNVTKGFFSDCMVFGAVLLNSTAFSVIMHSYISDGVYIEDAFDTFVADNWFDVNANVYVISIYFTSTNVSFYENTFLGEFYLFDCNYCNIVNNRFFNSVVDDGSINYWDSNGYADYDGFGPYIIPGSADSVDLNPYPLETDTTPIPPTTTPPIGTISPTTTTAISGSIEDYILIGVICFEIGVVIMIVMMRRKVTQ
ncbi:MAG: hypothetical protein ACXABV_14430 [Candidatus Thorarchaeota archaeon]